MPFRRVTCIIAVCDIPGCGNSADLDGATAHFDSEAEAAEHTLADPDCYANVWHQRPDGRLVCWIRDPLHDWAREQDGKTQPGRDAMSVHNLHPTAFKDDGMPRYSGYALVEQPIT